MLLFAVLVLSCDDTRVGASWMVHTGSVRATRPAYSQPYSFTYSHRYFAMYACIARVHAKVLQVPGILRLV